MEKSLFEQIGGTYRQVGDYLLPNISIPEEMRPIGIWGQRHLEYIIDHRKGFYTRLLIGGTLNTRLAEIDTKAEEMFSRLVKQMAEREGVTEQLKADNQMAWVCRMNDIRSRATEVVNTDLIYA